MTLLQTILKHILDKIAGQNTLIMRRKAITLWFHEKELQVERLTKNYFKWIQHERRKMCPKTVNWDVKVKS